MTISALPDRGKPQGISLAAYIDATDQAMEKGFVSRLRVLEDLKALRGDSFEGSAILSRAGGTTRLPATVEPVWRGTRKFVIRGSRSAGIDSDLIESRESCGPPAPDELGIFFAENMTPCRMNLTYICGHGLGTKAAGMTMEDLANALDAGRRISGHKPDILFLEACMMGHLDGLRALQGKASVAIVSEETMAQEALPLCRMMLKAGEGDSAIPSATAMVREAAGNRGVRTMAAVNLEKIEPLAKAVDRVKDLLKGEMETEAGVKLVRRAIHASYYALPVARSYGYGDLGEFLKSLSREKLRAETKQAVDKASGCLNEAVLATEFAPNYSGLSGLSFNTAIGGKHFTWQELLAGA